MKEKEPQDLLKRLEEETLSNAVNDFFIATLERSGLIPAPGPLRRQRPNKAIEARVNRLFKALTER
jgi:hypothetical protein